MRARTVARVLTAAASIGWFMFWMDAADRRSMADTDYRTGRVIAPGQNPIVPLLTAYTPVPLIAYLLLRWARRQPPDEQRKPSEPQPAEPAPTPPPEPDPTPIAESPPPAPSPITATPEPAPEPKPVQPPRTERAGPEEDELLRIAWDFEQIALRKTWKEERDANPVRYLAGAKPKGKR